jgi:DNA mismatch endonuclease, patch repair protein
MASVGTRNTSPELAVRRLVHRPGYRYGLHSKRLPGKPDLVFSSRRKVIFVHGCFWHGHEGCEKSRPPKSRLTYWLPKLEQNKIRDARNVETLRKLGWSSLAVWQCELKDEQEQVKILQLSANGREYLLAHGVTLPVGRVGGAAH